MIRCSKTVNSVLFCLCVQLLRVCLVLVFFELGGFRSGALCHEVLRARCYVINARTLSENICKLLLPGNAFLEYSCVTKFSMHFNSDLDYLYSIYEDGDTFEGLSTINARAQCSP